jgi:C1A family cysteine protease
MSRYATKKVNNNFYTTQDIKKPLNWVVFILFINHYNTQIYIH